MAGPDGTRAPPGAGTRASLPGIKTVPTGRRGTLPLFGCGYTHPRSSPSETGRSLQPAVIFQPMLRSLFTHHLSPHVAIPNGDIFRSKSFGA